MERVEGSPKFPVGSRLPAFSLRGTDGRDYSQDYFDEAHMSLVVFTCNHCPYVKGSERLLLEAVIPWLEKGLKVLSICSNDESKYPDDSFTKMKEKAENLPLPYPYLQDKDQSVAALFDAQCTPECYLFSSDKKLVYHGAINDFHKDPSKVQRAYLAEALESLAQKGSVPKGFIPAAGCSIKWAV